MNYLNMKTGQASTKDVGQWLQSLGLERYQAAFRENDIDGEVLSRLTSEDLKELGVVSVGDRRRLLDAIAALKAEFGRPAGVSPSAASRGGVGDAAKSAERRQLTVLFCDLVGSTALSGKLDPEDLRSVLTSFQKVVSEAVRRFDGYVAKFLGDGVLAYFGYPHAHEDDAERAVRAALEASHAVQHLVPALGFSLNARCGIATGVVVVGDVAEEGVSEPGAISGETPNLAARLQATANPGDIVIAQGTYRLVAGIFDFEDLGPQSLKGIADPVVAWRVKAERRGESRFDTRHSAALTQFVGRRDEVELLLRRWEQTKAGEGQVVLISGEPGIGKSRLTRHVKDSMTKDVHTALKYQCSPHHINSSLYPVISQLTFAAGIAADDSVRAKLDKLEALLAGGASDVVPIAPLIADLLSIPWERRYPALDLTPQARKARTLEALKNQLVGLARRRPVVLVFEDLHWLDPTTQELLDLMVEQIQQEPVLAVMTFRPEYQPRWVGQSHVTLMSLNRLSRRQSTEMAQIVAARVALPAGALDEIVQKTEGVPLFVEELTRAVLEGGPNKGVPATIQASLLARLDRLGDAKEVAQVGAAIGREFDHTLLAKVSPIVGQKLNDCLERLLASELVFRRGVPPDATYTFKHALVQDAAYESLLKSRRRKIHADIAAALRDQSPSLDANQPELLAHHYTEAGLAEPAIGYWRKAGDRANERSAGIEALRHYGAALTLLEALPQEVRLAAELPLQIGLGSALILVEGYSAPATGAAYRRARELCLALGDKEHLLQVVYGLSGYDHCAARYEAALQSAGEFMGLAEERGEPGPIVMAHSTLGTTLAMMGSWKAARRNLELCRELYDLKRDASLKYEYAEDPCVQAQGINSLVLWQLGYPDRAIESAQSAIRLARELQHTNSIGFALAMPPLLYYFIGDPQTALNCAREASAYGKEKGLVFWFLLTGAFGGWARTKVGQASEGIAEIHKAIELFHAAGNGTALTASHAALADAYWSADRREDAMAAIGNGLQFADERNEGFCKVELLRLCALITLERSSGDSEHPEKVLLDALELARSQEAKSMELRVSTDLAKHWRSQGKTKAAYDLLAPIHAWFTEGFGTPDLKAARALLTGLRT